MAKVRATKKVAIKIEKNIGIAKTIVMQYSAVFYTMWKSIN